jgi:hypothetical protein
MMALLPKSQKRVLLVKMIEEVIKCIPLVVKVIVMTGAVLVGTKLGLSSWSMLICLAIINGNNIRLIFDLLKSN